MQRLQLVCALALVRLVSWIVPRRFRARWIAEWHGEIYYLSSSPDRNRAGPDHARPGVFSRSFSSIRHAQALARQEWSPDMLVQDLRYALRRLRSNPGFVLVAVLTIAIGVGANTAIFSVINSTLIHPLPYPNGDRVVYLWKLVGASGYMRTPSGEEIDSWRGRMDAFEDMEVWATKHVTITGQGEPTEVLAARVSTGFFAFLGVQPSQGRGFSIDDVRDDARVAVISDGFWNRHLGGVEEILGYRLMLSGEPYEVIGVLSRGYVPHAPFLSTEIFLPLVNNEIGPDDNPVAIGRLAPGVSAQVANDEFDALAAALGEDAEPGRVMLPQEMAGVNLRTSLFTLQAAVGFVLLIAAANVANLLLARGTAQQREMAVRSAMGAGRRRLLRQLLTENLMLALGGGLLGYGLARVGVAVILAFKPETMQGLESVRVDGSMLWFALGVSMLTGVVFGLVPAVHGSRPDVLDQLKDATRSGTSSSRRVWVRNSFVVAEVALSIVLLVGAGLLLASLGSLLGSDIGFDAENVLTLSVDLPDDRYPDAENRTAFRRQLEERFALVTGDRVESMGVASSPPPNSGVWFSTFEAEEQEVVLETTPVYVTSISPGYLETMRIPLVDGRDFIAGDEDDDGNPVIISAEWARRLWGEEKSAGRRFYSRGSESLSSHTVVGVVDDPKLGGPAARFGGLMAFLPQGAASSSLSFAFRARENPLALADELKAQVWSLDPDLPIEDVALVEDLVAGTLAPHRFNAILMTLAAVVAVSLALIGLYGVLSYSVGQRTREIGIRMALGAERRSVVPMVAWQGMRLVLIGVGVGIVAALGLTRFIESLLHGVEAFDVTTYAAVAATLVFVSVLACLVPAARAARLDPMVALRSE